MWNDWEHRFGTQLADELLCLGYLVDHLQWDGFPWLVSASARGEIERFRGHKQPDLLRGWKHLSDLQAEWALDSFRGVAPSVLDPTTDVRINPLILRGLGVNSVEKIRPMGGSLSPLRDPAIALVRDALLSGFPRDPHDGPSVFLEPARRRLRVRRRNLAPSDALRGANRSGPPTRTG